MSGPDPGKYDPKSDFSKLNHKLPAYTFGTSNNAFRKAVIHNKVESVDNDIPGPGSYKTNHMIGKEGKWLLNRLGWKITMGIGGKNAFSILCIANLLF